MADELQNLAEKIDSLVAEEERQMKNNAVTSKGKIQKPAPQKKAVDKSINKEQKVQPVRTVAASFEVVKPKAKRGRPAKK
jgi:hypothetical protein